MRSPHDKHIGSPVKKNALLLSILLSLFAFGGQLLGAWYTGSIALLGDTAHVFTDLFSLVMSYLAVVLISRPANEVRSFGLYRLEVLAAFLNGLLLVLVSLVLIWEGVDRLRHPSAILALPLIYISIFGLIMNLFSALLLMRAMKKQEKFILAEDGGETFFTSHMHPHSCGHSHAGHGHDQHEDRNLNSAFLHVLSDALGSVAVIIGAVCIYLFECNWVDPILGIILSLIILRWGLRLTFESGHVLLEGTPAHIKPQEVIKELKVCDARIERIEDLHIWEITSSMYAATAEVAVTPSLSLKEGEEIRQKLEKILREKYAIAHIVLAVRI